MMNDATTDRLFSLNPQPFNVVSIYDDAVTRERAMQVCDHLVKLLWEDAELKFHWWRTHFFRDAGLAEIAAQNAAEADFVILSNSNDSAISPELKAWFESWVDRREVNDGALVNLVARAGTTANIAYRDGFLQEISRRAKLDLLSVPSPAGKSSAEVLIDIRDSFSQRPMHTHFGLNE